MHRILQRTFIMVGALALLVAGGAPEALPTTLRAAAAGSCTSNVSNVGPGIPPPAAARGGVDGFHTQWHGQSGYMQLCAGEQSTAIVAFRNIGSFGWVRSEMGQAAYLGTSGPTGQDMPSLLGGVNTGWPRANRIAAQPAAYVGPGQVSWFQFSVQAPASPGVYTLYLRPVIEGARWMEDYGVHWRITVLNADGSPPPSLPESAAGPVAAPIPPSPYSVPGGALAVSSSAGLVSALASGTPRDIVLADGTYDNAVPFANPRGHRIYAARLLGARLTAGINMAANGGSPGALVRGIAFDVSDPAKAFQGNVIFTWGGPTDVRVLDSTFNGHRTMASALRAQQPEGLVVQRVQIHDFVEWGILADNNTYNSVLQRPMLLEDIDVANVSHAVPKSGQGMSEACLAVGNTAVVRRVRVRNCAWMGVMTVSSSHGSLFEHLDIDGGPYAGVPAGAGSKGSVGLYIEHFTSGSTFQRMRIGPNLAYGVLSEGTDPAGSQHGGVAASKYDVIQDSTIDTREVGVLMGWITTVQTVRGVVFSNQYVAAITDYKGIGNVYDGQGNDYSRILPGARAVSPVWWR